MQDMFSGFENKEMAFVTVVLPAVRDLSDLHESFKKGLCDLRNRVRACRRASSLWNDLAIVGWLEIDAVAVEQVQFLAPERRDLLLSIAPIGCDTLGPIWVPTFHAVAYLGHNTIADLGAALRQQWPLPGQADVQQFWMEEEFERNLDRLVGYVNKFSCSTDLCAPVRGAKIADPWPPVWEAALLTWLHSGHRNAFERMRFSVQQRRPRQDRSAVPELDVDQAARRSEPLPFATSFAEAVFTSDPMYKYYHEDTHHYPSPGPSDWASYRGPP
jgi:hypothetical protein